MKMASRAQAASSNSGKRDPYTQERDAQCFLRELRQFHQSRGTAFRHSPRINGRELDLHLLYAKVTALGGCHKVNASRKWDTLLSVFNIPTGCPNAGLALKQIYLRYLDHYEKIHFLGEDPNEANLEKTDSRGRKLQHIAINQVPMVYNHHQHELTDVLRVQLGLSQDAAVLTEYDKLTFSLLSGLPNEVDFAINICTLLSNGSRHTLSLDKCPRLIELLIAHAGVWSDTNNTIRGLLEASWQRQEGRNMAAFWEDTLEDEEIRELLGPWDGKSKDVVEEDNALFNLVRNQGVRDSEGQRVLQIASIMRNLSFEESNISMLVSSPICLKFLLLCAHCRWSNLRQLGLDALGCLSSEMVLDPCDELSTQLIFRTLSFNILSNDRFLIIKSLEMLIGLCQLPVNEDMLVRNLTTRVYERVCTYLTIHDIMLLVYTLEFLFHITQFGGEPCNKIARLHGIIAILIDLMTFEAQSYGPNGCIAMKLVDSPQPATHCGGMMAAPVTPSHKTQATTFASYSSSHSHRPNAIPIPAGYQELDNETFACTWLKATYEINSGLAVSHTDVYNEYQNVCIKLGKKGLIGPTQLSHYIRSVFPHVMPRRTDASSELMMDGIRKRSHPLPVSIIAPIGSSTSHGSQHASANLGYPLTVSPSVTSSCASPNRSQSPLTSTPNPNGHSPILKAQLSAPPRGPPPPPPQLKASHQQQQKQPSSPPSPATPNKDASSNLIKSLLANKVNQNIQRQQQQQLLLNQQKQVIPTTTTAATTTATVSPAPPMPLPRTYQRTPMSLPGISPANYKKTSISVPMTLEECLGPPTSGATGSTAPSPRSPRMMPSQLSAMLGHCEPPPPLPPPNLTKELITGQSPAKTKHPPDDGPPGEPIAGQDTGGGGGSKSPTKMRINGIQRALPMEICGSVAAVPAKVDGVAANAVGRTEENHVATKRVDGLVADSTVPPHQNSRLFSDGPPATSPTNEMGVVRVEQRRGLFGARLTLHNGNKVIVPPTTPSTPTTAAAPPTGVPTNVITATPTAAAVPVVPMAPVGANSVGAKHKGLLADLLDGKVHKDSFLLMNGVLDKKVDRRVSEPVIPTAPTTTSSTNHQQSTVSVEAPIVTSATSSTMTPVPKNCNLTNGESFNNHTAATPGVVPASLTPAQQQQPMMMPARVAASVVGQGGAVRPGSAMRVAAGPVLAPATTLKPVGAATLSSVGGATTRHQTVITGNVRAAMINNRFQPIKPAAVQSSTTSSTTTSTTTTASPELIGYPRVSMEQLNQIGTPTVTTATSTTTTTAVANSIPMAIKRSPAVFAADNAADAKRLRLCDNASTLASARPLPASSLPPSLASPSVGTATTGTPPLTLKISIPPSASSASHGKTIASSMPVTPAAGSHHVQTNFVLKRDPTARTSSFVMSPVVSTSTAVTTPAPSVTTTQKLQVRLVPGNPADLAASSAEATARAAPVAVQAKKGSESSEQQRPATVALPVATPTVKLRYFCEWKDCQRSFESPSSVFFHACKVHAPKGNVSIPCLWDNCDQMVRQRLSHMTHLQDRHCSEQVLRSQAVRKQEATRGGPPAAPVPAATPPPHPGYAPNAALHAIKRHALEFLNPREFADEKEGPVTKSVRLTAALIFRNLIVYSTLAKKTAKQYESFLATLAINNVEASQTVAHCLAELGNYSEHPPKK